MNRNFRNQMRKLCRGGYLCIAMGFFLFKFNQVYGELVLQDIRLGFYKTSIEFVEFNTDTKFNPNIFEYDATVEQLYTDNIYITPIVAPTSSVYMIAINGTKALFNKPFKHQLKIGKNDVEITLIGENGGLKMYKIAIMRTDLSDKYTSHVIAPGVLRIGDYDGFVGNESMYLFKGEKKALLFDTGMGKGDLLAFIKSLTHLPIEVVITHAHRDHYGQVDQFKENTIYMSRRDSSMLPPEVSKQRFQWVNDGSVIDIGGRRFEVIEMPGHTMGSLLFLDRQNKMMITGDAVGSGTMVYMFSTKSAPLTTYLNSLKNVGRRLNGLDGLMLLVGHSYQEKVPLIGKYGIKYFEDMRTAVEKVLSGELMGHLTFNVAPYGVTALRQAYLGLAGLWYNPSDEGIK